MALQSAITPAVAPLEQYSVLRSIGPSGVKIIEGPTLVDAENNPHDFEEGSWATLLQLCPEFGQVRFQ